VVQVSIKKIINVYEAKDFLYPLNYYKFF